MSRFSFRRLQFSLRTLFVVVTLIGMWFGWQAYIVRTRKVLLDKCDKLGVLYLQGDIDPAFVSSVPEYRRWFGDRPIYEFDFWPTLDPNVLDEIKSGFPEAKFYEMKAGKQTIRVDPHRHW